MNSKSSRSVREKSLRTLFIAVEKGFNSMLHSPSIRIQKSAMLSNLKD